MTIENTNNEKLIENDQTIILIGENQNESTVNEINPIKPISLNLPKEIIIKGIVRNGDM